MRGRDTTEIIRHYSFRDQDRHVANLFPDLERIYRLDRRPLQALSGLKAELSLVQRAFDHGTLDEALGQISVFMAADVIDGVKPILDTKNSDLPAFDRDRLRLVGRDLVGFADAFPHARTFFSPKGRCSLTPDYSAAT